MHMSPNKILSFVMDRVKTVMPKKKPGHQTPSKEKIYKNLVFLNTQVLGDNRASPSIIVKTINEQKYTSHKYGF